MSPDAIWLALVAASALLLAWAWRSACREDQRQWRTSTQVERDVAACRSRLETTPAIEQQPGDPYSDDRLQLELMFIPAQRQPRKDQP